MAAPALGSDWRSKYPTVDQQAEFFLLKFAKDEDISRDKVFGLMKQFRSFDSRSQGELEEDEAMRLLEKRNETKTFTELRQMVADIDLDKNRKLSFLEWACAIFNKSWVNLHTPSVDPAEVARAEELANQAYAAAAEKKAKEDFAREQNEKKRLEELRAAMDKSAAEQGVEAAAAAKAALEAELVRQEQERRARDEAEKNEQQRRAEEDKRRREQELSRPGVAGKAALFKYAAQDSQDVTQSNEARIRTEAAKRKAEKEAKLRSEEEKRLADEETARAKKAAAEAAKKAEEAAEAARRAAELAAIAEQERMEAEKRQREAEEEKAKALAGTEAERRQRELYEEARQKAEEEARLKKEAEEAKRNAGRAKIAARAALWNKNNSPGDVIADINQGNVKLNTTGGQPRDTNPALTAAKLQAGIKKGAELKHVSKPSTDLTEAQKQAFLEDRNAPKEPEQ